MARVIKLVLLLTSLYASQMSAFVIESIIGGAIISSSLYAVPTIYCQFTECCRGKWIAPNITGLQTSLGRRVFGQHLVTKTVLKAVAGHLNNKSPSKALALSFNGWTGSGKNFVSKIIAEHIFRKGMDSNFVHQIIATHDFPHQSDVEYYKRQLRSLVAGSVSKCSRSLFIFDEMDKMPTGLIDILKPYLDHYPDVGKIDYRQSIFIFLSNTGGHLINNAVLTHWKEERKERT
ncbi:chaperone cofactor-dependent protein refolding [Desmophyllum pertusum]|uniref:Chaperone cofactor-dependent protein refolding n=1 Tax=Desmophyllum pertusum TaxID=174260 RepID=A0A9X0CSZ1_9CNID|nr:chaperone cofactor-dependent protein refolding [Desmophyllum pertusum]